MHEMENNITNFQSSAFGRAQDSSKGKTSPPRALVRQAESASLQREARAGRRNGKWAMPDVEPQVRSLFLLPSPMSHDATVAVQDWWGKKKRKSKIKI